MFSKRSREGSLLIDNRANHGGLLESATITCSHCHRIVILNPNRTRERGWCSKCDHYICDNPACHFECLPLNKVIDDLQESAMKERYK